VHELLVRRDVARIFAYRTERLRQRFTQGSGVDLPPNAADFGS
jgi:hypothetical protein